MSTFPDYFTEYKKPNIKECYDIRVNPSLRKNIVTPYTDSKYISLKQILKETYYHFTKGTDMKLFTNYQRKYSPTGSNYMSNNLLIPYYNEYDDSIRDLVLLCHPDDCQRIASTHVKKMPNLKCIMADSVISTTDNNHWIKQRRHFVNAFIPFGQLKNVVHISEQRAKFASKLMEIKIKKNNLVDMNDWFLNETQAQLQLALLGTKNEYQELINQPIREAFTNSSSSRPSSFLSCPKKGFVRKTCLDISDKVHNDELQGILGKLLHNSPQETESELYGNIVLFLFAGHDTTGHTLTWLMLELCKNQKIQHRLKKEVSNFWMMHNDIENIALSEFANLPFMDKCIAETLRMYPAVANGSFRELQHDDWITGKDGNKVFLKKGTFVQIPNYFRHRNPQLWKDPMKFNPDRYFEKHEVWSYNQYKNPESNRYSPFMYNSRSCLGKHFAQIEMRLMLLYLLKTFSFDLARTQEPSNIECNKGTMGPRNGMYVNVYFDRSRSKL